MRLLLLGVLFFWGTHLMAQTEEGPQPSATHTCSNQNFSADFMGFIHKELTIDHVVTVEKGAEPITLAIYRDVAAFLWWEQHNGAQAKEICKETTAEAPFCECVKQHISKGHRVAIWKNVKGEYRACIP